MKRLAKDEFRVIANWTGLDVDDQVHMEALYKYVQNILSMVSKMYDLEIPAVSPFQSQDGVYTE